MKIQNAPRSWAVTALLLAPVLALAEDAPILRVKLEEPQTENKNRFGVSYRMGFNVTAQFKNVGGLGSPGGAGRGPGRGTGGGTDRNYEDGYNRVDSSGNRDGLTWNWAYRNDSQIVGDTLVMHSRVAQPINSKTWDNDPQHGFEITYGRELGICQKTGWHWGIEGAFGWTDIDIRDNRPLSGGGRLISDAYDLGGVDPSGNQIPEGANQPAPVGESRPGTFEGPGPLIDDSPTRMVDPFGALVTGTRRFDANLWTYRLGPYVDFPIDDRWTFTFSAGAAMAVMDGEFSYRQFVTSSGFQSGRGSNTEVLWGGYLSGVIRYAIDEHWGVFLGGQYLGLTCYEAKARGQKVEIDFGRTALATMGVSFSF